MSFLKYFSAAFSQPKPDKLLFRTIRELQPRSIVEVGIGDGKRTSQIINAAIKYGDVSYCVIDMFEASPANRPHLSIKEAHRQLSGLRAQVRLLPGDACSTLKRSANELTGTNLLIIATTQSVESLKAVWSYVPRMLAENSRILVEVSDGGGWKVLSGDELPSVDRVRQRRSAA